MATTTTTTTTTTTPPCPLATTTLSPCEKYRREQEAKAKRPVYHGSMSDQPRPDYAEYQSFMADQPELMAVQEDTPPQTSFDFRGDSESLNTANNPMMESALPLGIRRNANQDPRLSLYQTFQEPARNYQPSSYDTVQR